MLLLEVYSLQNLYLVKGNMMCNSYVSCNRHDALLKFFPYLFI